MSEETTTKKSSHFEREEGIADKLLEILREEKVVPCELHMIINIINSVYENNAILKWKQGD